jgi:aryl-alcohol dehydrogenase-like predicted oxidoreductase
MSGLATHDINTSEDWRLAELKFTKLGTAIMRSRERAVNFPARSSHIVLGTVQLGIDYGIANSLGRPSEQRANRILESAYLGGVRIFDTAQAYGTSEAVLGAFFKENTGLKDWRVVTKLKPDIDTTNAEAICAAVRSSIRTLGSHSLWALLLHREKQLDLWDQVIGRTLIELKADGLIENLGVSVGSISYMRAALQHPDIDVVEFPANVFDRRAFRAGVHALELANRKTVMVRSVFLQGLVCLNERAIPISIPRAREAVSALRRFCTARNIEAHQFAYDYVRVRHPNALILLGAESPEQAAENSRLADRKLITQALADEWDRNWPEDIPGLIDPSTWRLPVGTQVKRDFIRILRKLLPF